MSPSANTGVGAVIRHYFNLKHFGHDRHGFLFCGFMLGFIASIVRRVQSGFLYSYAFWMVIGLAVMLGWFLTRT